MGTVVTMGCGASAETSIPNTNQVSASQVHSGIPGDDSSSAAVATGMGLGTEVARHMSIHGREQWSAHMARTGLEHRSAFDIYSEPNKVRRTSIICTIGPKTKSVEKLTSLRNAGMNIARMNFSHGSYEYHGEVVDNVRAIPAPEPTQAVTPVVAIALDTKGPEIRTGLMLDGQDVTLEKGSKVTVTTDDAKKEACTADTVYVDYKNIGNVLKVGSVIFIDDGLISLEVKAINGTEIETECMNQGALSSRKGVNLPNVDVDLPPLSEKDTADLKFGVEKGIDMVFASFIRKASDVEAYRAVFGEAGKGIKVISKIENHEGVRNFDEILAASDGIMVARGDLGIEIPAQKVFVAQKMMIAKCNLAGKPVICATQMLESMTFNPRPTRAEVSDVANAVLDGADCVMLSGETAKGNYPLEAVGIMAECCLEAEACFHTDVHLSELKSVLSHPIGIERSVCLGAVDAALQNDASAIICLTHSGETARLLSQFRPRCPILVVTREAQTARQVHLYRGCYPLLYTAPTNDNLPWQDDVDTRFAWAVQQFKDRGLLRPGSMVIGVQGSHRGAGHTNVIRYLPPV